MRTFLPEGDPTGVDTSRVCILFPEGVFRIP